MAELDQGQREAEFGSDLGDAPGVHALLEGVYETVDEPGEGHGEAEPLLLSIGRGGEDEGEQCMGGLDGRGEAGGRADGPGVEVVECDGLAGERVG
jgi:hypothetical protein